jgi:DNA polymerase III subunit delta'
MAFQHITGQSRAKRFLQQLVRVGRIPHALLFSGMAGIGKAALAREFAKFLNCRDGDPPGCGDRCACCRKIENGQHPDLLWLAPEGNYIKIEQVRTLRGQLRFRPFEAKWRVVVIQDAQQLKEEAANALLKILEEPPQRNVIVLLVLEPQMLLPTLVSRCCRVRLQPLEDAQITDYLISTHQMTPLQAQQVTRLAAGSLDRARQLTESGELAAINMILETTQDLARMSLIEFFQRMEQWTKQSSSLDRDLEVIQMWLRDLIIHRLLDQGPRQRDQLGPVIPEQTRDALRGIPIDRLFDLYQHMANAVQHLRRNANRQLTLEGVCLTIKDLLYGEGCWDSFSRGMQNLSF